MILVIRIIDVINNISASYLTIKWFQSKSIQKHNAWYKMNLPYIFQKITTTFYSFDCFFKINVHMQIIIICSMQVNMNFLTFLSIIVSWSADSTELEYLLTWVDFLDYLKATLRMFHTNISTDYDYDCFMFLVHILYTHHLFKCVLVWIFKPIFCTNHSIISI